MLLLTCSTRRDKSDSLSVGTCFVVANAKSPLPALAPSPASGPAGRHAPFGASARRRPLSGQSVVGSFNAEAMKLGASAEDHFWKHFESAFVIGLEERRLDVNKKFDEKERRKQSLTTDNSCARQLPIKRYRMLKKAQL